MFLLSAMFSQRVKKLTVKLMEPPCFLCPIVLCFSKRSLRVLNKWSCSWHLGVGKGRGVSAAFSFLHLRKLFSWCCKKKKKKIPRVSKLELLFYAFVNNYIFYILVYYCCCFSCQAFHMLSINIYQVFYMWERKRVE